MKFELRYIIPIIILAITAGCSDAPVPACGAGHDMRPLSFSADAASIVSSSRALQYDGLKTQFTDGTLIGCVIAYKNPEAEGGYEYQANSCWTWHPDGLELTKLLDSDNAPVNINGEGNDILRHFTAEEIAAEELADDPHAPYFIRLLNKTADYAFFFYYPYIDADILTNAVNSAQNNADNYGFPIKAWSQPSPDATLAFYVNNSVEEDFATTKFAKWTKYPVIPHDDFSKGIEEERLNNSDFMHAIVDKAKSGIEINNTNATQIGELPVNLHKKMVTMDFLFAETPDEGTVKLEPQLKDYAPVMVRIRYFNIMTGEFTGAYPYQQYISDHPKGFASYTGTIYPRKMASITEQETEYTVYRVVLPPQSLSEVLCNFSFSINGAPQTLKGIENNPLLAELKSGYYYRIRFSKTGDDTGWHLSIEDWKEGSTTTLTRPD